VSVTRCARAIVFTALISAAITGCRTPPKPPMYYYGDYERALYKIKKSPDAANGSKYQASLEDVIKGSKEKSIRVPPGIYCEYGYVLWQKGRHSEAEAQFALEMQTYPESVPFVTLVLNSLKHVPAT
jgi:hypothetical protein